MSETTFPDIETLTKLMEHAIVKVMQTTAQTNGKFVRRFAADEVDGTPFYRVGARDPLIAGSVGFTGEANGVVYLFLEMDTAAQIGARITGLEVRELLEPSGYDVIKDLVGEMTNMIVGTFKNCICDLGFQCKVTLPTVLHGSQLKVEAINSTQRWTFHFQVLERPMIAELFLQQENFS